MPSARVLRPFRPSLCRLRPQGAPLITRRRAALRDPSTHPKPLWDREQLSTRLTPLRRATRPMRFLGSPSASTEQTIATGEDTPTLGTNHRTILESCRTVSRHIMLWEGSWGLVPPASNIPPRRSELATPSSEPRRAESQQQSGIWRKVG